MVTTHRKAFLLATASGVAASGMADAQAAALDTTNWTGWYAGLNISGTQSKASETDVNGWGRGGLQPLSYVTPFFSSSTVGFGVGAQGGYNWQFDNLVFGGEADISWINAKNTFIPPGIGAANGTVASASNELNWMSSFRGRVGITFNNLLVYGTAGVAVAGINDHWGYGFPGFPGPTTPFSNSQFKFDGVRTGFIYGGGVEYVISRNWTGRAEMMYANFGSTNNTITGFPAFGAGPGTFTTVFHNSATIGRLALSYRW